MKKIYVLLLPVLILFGCKNTSESDVITAESETPDKVHMAFAGGGWRAHTGHSAWTIGLLEEGTKTLDSVFKNVEVMSSNSGGSWFSTMLTFSDTFVQDIQSPDAHLNWATSSGWTGKQKAAFDAVTICYATIRDEYLECVFDHYTDRYYDGGTYWKLMVETLIYKDYPLTGMTLSHPRQKWAHDKPLLLASTLLNNQVVLNYKSIWGNNHRYYQACVSPSQPWLKGDKGSECTDGIPKDVSPATFSSIPSHVSYQPSPFFAQLGTDSNSSILNLGYTSDYVKHTPPKDSTTVQLPLNGEKVHIMTAAAASSAALGFGASAHITGIFDVSYILEDNAVSFSLEGGKVAYMDVDDMKVPDLAANSIVRLADGGPVDNSGVAQLVRSLQLNGKDDNFHIVAFDNVGDISNPFFGIEAEVKGPAKDRASGAASVGIDIASLFGFSDPFSFTVKVLGYDLTTYKITNPTLQIFESDPLYKTSASWTHIEGGNQLVYTAYPVKTIQNDTLGIKKGSQGILHSFTCAYPSAGIAPTDGDADFNTYADMFSFIVNGLKTEQNGKTGLENLREALGLKSE